MAASCWHRSLTSARSLTKVSHEHRSARVQARVNWAHVIPTDPESEWNHYSVGRELRLILSFFASTPIDGQLNPVGFDVAD